MSGGGNAMRRAVWILFAVAGLAGAIWVIFGGRYDSRTILTEFMLPSLRQSFLRWVLK